MAAIRRMYGTFPRCEWSDHRRAQTFYFSVGHWTQNLQFALVSPNKPGDKSFAELVQALKSHYNPEPSEIIECYKFHTRFRKPGESVVTFVSELRTLAQTCNFGDSLGDMLRDRLVPVHSEVDIPFLKPNYRSLVQKHAVNWERMTHSKVLLRDGASAIER